MTLEIVQVIHTSISLTDQLSKQYDLIEENDLIDPSIESYLIVIKDKLNILLEEVVIPENLPEDQENPQFKEYYSHFQIFINNCKMDLEASIIFLEEYKAKSLIGHMKRAIWVSKYEKKLKKCQDKLANAIKYLEMAVDDWQNIKQIDQINRRSFIENVIEIYFLKFIPNFYFSNYINRKIFLNY